MTAKEIVEKFNKYKHTPDDDNIRIKNIIKNTLMDCDELLYALHNSNIIDYSDEDFDMETIDKEDFFGDSGNIKPYAIIPQVQTTPMNYVCYTTTFNEDSINNSLIKYGLIHFIILCDNRELNDVTTGIARHDLIASIIREKLNWTNIFGMQAKIVQDKETVVDTDYASRTLTFQLDKINSIVKTTDGVTRVINNDVVME